MQWILQYQLFLFDFDGLLVDTERLHHQAYVDMCAQRGFQLDWDFHRFSQAAHHKSTDLRDQIYAELPRLQSLEPNWQVLYEEKKKIFLDLIEQKNVDLLPGVENLLSALYEAKIKRCVVTHSGAPLVKRICQRQPILNTIPYWITREDYIHPKPHSECYQTAIRKFAQPHDRIIGFEDSPRGLEALIKTKAHPVLICHAESIYLEKMLHLYPNISYYPDFTHIQSLNVS